MTHYTVYTVSPGRFEKGAMVFGKGNRELGESAGARRIMTYNDGIPDDRWELAVLLYEARKRDACAWMGKNWKAPERKGYTHNPTAEFDFALIQAKAVLKRHQITNTNGGEG